MSVRRFWLLALVAAIIGVNLWLQLGHFVPVLRTDQVEYRLLAAPWMALIGSIAVAFLALLALHACCVRYLFKDRESSSLPRDWRETRYMAPLTLVAFNLIALGNLVPVFHGRIQPWSYISVDLQVWMALGILVLFATEIDRRSAGALREQLLRRVSRFAPKDIRHAIEVGILCFAFAWAYFSTPLVRFDADLLGDEPKYIRYCENLYQGHGFDVSQVETIEAKPFADPAALLQNITGALALVPREWRHFREDVASLLREGPSYRFNRAKYLGGFFVEGKDGGVYQAHSPGLSILLMPAYYIDRHFLNWRSAGEKQGDPNTFPEHLVMTNIAELLLYGLLGVAIFRLLVSATGRTGLSAGLAVATLATPPVSAFAFQFYPEVAAAIIVTVATRRLLYEPDTSSVQAVFAGFLVGYLTWLHVRFLALIAVFLVWGGLVAWRSMRTRLAFLAGCALPLGAYCLYAYHATGSFMPTAFYDARGPMLDVHSAGPGLFAFAFDADFGLLAHAPILILALLGVPFLVATYPRAALFCALVVAAEFATAAAKDFTAGLTSPGRFVIAVMPLFTIPLAASIIRFGRSGIFRAWCGLLLIISVQTAWVYNVHHRKAVGKLVDQSFSGWRLSLTFPNFHGSSWVESGFHSPLLPIWIAVVVSAVSLPYFVTRRGRVKPVEGHTTLHAFAAILALALLSSTVGLLADRKFEPSYLMPPDRASAAVREYLEHTSPAFDVSRTATSSLFITKQAPTAFRVELTRRTPDPDDPLRFRFDAGEEIAIDVTIDQAPGTDPKPGLLTVAFDDGTSLPPTKLYSTKRLTHAYGKPGTYHLRANLLVDKQWMTNDTPVQVGAPAVAGPRAESLAVDAIEGFPRDVTSIQPTITVSRITVAGRQLCFEFSGAAEDQLNARASQVWLAAMRNDIWEARMYGTLTPAERCIAISDGTGNAGLPPRPHPYHTGVLIAFPATSAADRAGIRKAARSRLNVVWWPREEALLAAPIVFRPEAQSFLQEVADR